MHRTEERLLKVELRLAALEYLVANMYAAALPQRPGADLELKAANDALRHNLRQQTVPGIGAAWSDHITAEMHDAMDRVLVIMEEMAKSAISTKRKHASS